MSNDRRDVTLKQATGLAVQVIPARLPMPREAEVRGIDAQMWQTLTDTVWPTARSVAGILLAVDYCRARKLDPLKKPVHVVPIWDRTRGALVDTIWPGISEVRTTATRTGEYAGCDEAIFGPVREFTFTDTNNDDRTGETTVREKKLAIPEWCQITVYRLVKGQRIAFPGPKVFWLETYATRGKDSDFPNEMWESRPMGQLEKCAEAAALRRAFPEECGGDYIPEEIERGAVKEAPISEVSPERQPPRPQREDFKQVEAMPQQPKPAERAGDDAPKPVQNETPQPEQSRSEPEAKPEEPEKPKAEAPKPEPQKAESPKAEAPKTGAAKPNIPLPDPWPSEEIKAARLDDDWLLDQFKLLAACKIVPQVDEIQVEVETELAGVPALRAIWTKFCNAKAAEILRAGKKPR